MSKIYPSKVKRKILSLIFNHGMSSQEAARRTGISYGTVRRWVRETNASAETKKNDYIIRILENQLERAVEEREILKETVSGRCTTLLVG